MGPVDIRRLLTPHGKAGLHSEVEYGRGEGEERCTTMWSKFKKLLKKVWRVVKAVVRAGVRVGIFGGTFPFKIWDLAFGFLAWPPKKMKVHIAVLQDQAGPLIKFEELNNLLPSIELLKKVYKDNCNVTVLPYSSGNEREIDNWAQVLNDPAPAAALDSGECRTWVQLDEQETGDAGEYFRQHTAGWVSGIPISLSFPITVFIVKSISGYFGCTIPFLSDYVLVSVDALKAEPSTIAHEIGHRCNILPHHDDRKNLMFSGNVPNLPPYMLKGWQKNLVRSSRHVTYLF